MTAEMWHITNRRNLNSIMHEGLRTDAPGWDTGYVWLFDNLGIAIEMARTGAWGGERGNNAILAVNVEGLALQPDPHPGWGDYRDAHSFVVAGNISPDRISTLTWT